MSWMKIQSVEEEIDDLAEAVRQESKAANEVEVSKAALQSATDKHNLTKFELQIKTEALVNAIGLLVRE